MSAQGYCAPVHPVERNASVSFIPPLTFLHHHRSKRDLRDPILRARFKLSPDDFPQFLWEGETMYNTDPAIGFLCHPILFAVSTPIDFSIQYQGHISTRPSVTS